MKKKMHVVRLQGEGGFAQRVIQAEHECILWIVYSRLSSPSWVYSMADALEWLDDKGVTDIKRVSKMSY